MSETMSNLDSLNGVRPMSAPATYRIRPAERADIQDIERLLRESDLPVAGVAGILDSAPGLFLVAIAPGVDGLIGVGGLELCGNDALLRSVAVAPAWQTAGVGRALVHGLLDLAESRGVNSMYLLTLTAERYFPRFGFTQISRTEVPAPVAATTEFTSVCPSTATVMMRRVAR